MQEVYTVGPAYCNTGGACFIKWVILLGWEYPKVQEIKLLLMFAARLHSATGVGVETAKLLRVHVQTSLT